MARDCEHGYRLGSCDICDLREAERKIEALEEENRRLHAEVERFKDPTYNSYSQLYSVYEEVFNDAREFREKHERICERHVSTRKRLEKKIVQLNDVAEKMRISYAKTIEFALNNETDDGMSFLRCWFNGDWKGCREWADDQELDAAIFYPEKLSEEGS